MSELLIATVVFVASHAFSAIRPLRRALVTMVGEKTFLIGYSLISLAVIGWLVSAYVRAPYIAVWPVVEWAYWVPILVMPLSCVLLATGLASPNPLSLTFRRQGFDPDKPGIVAVTRHPLLWALLLWAGAHIPSNGDVKSLILFVLLLISSLGGFPSLDGKRRGTLGKDKWQELSSSTSNLPFAAIFAGRTRTSLAEIGYLRILAGLIIFAVFLVGHDYVIGVSPLP